MVIMGIEQQAKLMCAVLQMALVGRDQILQTEKEGRKKKGKGKEKRKKYTEEIRNNKKKEQR